MIYQLCRSSVVTLKETKRARGRRLSIMEVIFFLEIAFVHSTFSSISLCRTTCIGILFAILTPNLLNCEVIVVLVAHPAQSYIGRAYILHYGLRCLDRRIAKEERYNNVEIVGLP